MQFKTLFFVLPALAAAIPAALPQDNNAMGMQLVARAETCAAPPIAKTNGAAEDRKAKMKKITDSLALAEKGKAACKASDFTSTTKTAAQKETARKACEEGYRQCTVERLSASITCLSMAGEFSATFDKTTDDCQAKYKEWKAKKVAA